MKSINELLKGHHLNDGVWVFGYGSLMWNPDFEIEERISGEVIGYHRKLCLKSIVYRGTPEYYGLVFGLDEGFSCQGLCFKIAREKLESELMKVWKREMFAETYIPTWVKVRTNQSKISAITFVINSNHKHYMPNIEIKDLAERVIRAEGRCGSCHEYVRNTYKQLDKFGLKDKKLEQLLTFIRSPKSDDK